MIIKSHIRETKHISADADSSIDTTVWWTKNTQKPDIFEKWKKIIQNSKTQKHLERADALKIYFQGPHYYSEIDRDALLDFFLQNILLHNTVQ